MTNKILYLLFIVSLSGCSSYNDPSDYEFSETVCTDNNGNKIIRCFSHINAFVDKKDWYYVIKHGDDFDYYELKNVDEQKLLFIKNYKRRNTN